MDTYQKLLDIQLPFLKSREREPQYPAQQSSKAGKKNQPQPTRPAALAKSVVGGRRRKPQITVYT